MVDNILVYVDCFERINFFYRLANSGEEIGQKYYFLTDSITSYRSLKSKKCDVYLLPKPSRNRTECYDFKNSLDILNGNQTITYANYYSHGIIEFLKNFPIKLNFYFIWNGSNTAGITLSTFAKEHNIKCIFFEISNLPGKIFVDSKGVNAKSWLYDNLHILDNLPEVDNIEFSIWIKYWKNYKLGTLPQSRILGTNHYNYYIDRIYSLIIKKPFVNKFTLKKPKARKKIIFNSDPCNLKDNFIFLPLQVSNDSQLKLNSNVNNAMAIDKANQIALHYGYKLYVKIHPAEFDLSEIEKILDKQKDIDFLIVNENTNVLIEKSKIVCVINSTVGLEAKILNKKTIVFGKAIYANLNNSQIKKYIMHWLVNIDYFSNDEISKYEYKTIFDKIGS